MSLWTPAALGARFALLPPRFPFTSRAQSLPLEGVARRSRSGSPASPDYSPTPSPREF